MSRGAVAAIVLGVVAIAFGVTAFLAWQSLGGLPERAEIRVAAETATEETASAAENTLSEAVPPRTASGELVPEPARRVRFVEQDGVVSILPEGPLLRAPSAAPPPEPIPPRGPEPDIYTLVVIMDAGIVDGRSRLLRLAHVDAPPADRICPREDGGLWPCGARARTALRRLVRRRAIECRDLDPEAPPPEAGVAVLTRCAVAGTDLSRWLVEQGWATPTEDAPEEWASLHETARAEGRGLYDPAGR